MQPGQLLGDRDRIEQALARGGFGETFLAIDTHLPSRPLVVVKLLKPIYNTSGYMPNEQSMGYPKPASDIYAVGAIAIQCLTGSHPRSLFDEDSLTIEWQHLRHVNRDFTTVLSKMVAPDYRQRYANATEALKAIESLIPSPQIPPSLTPVPTAAPPSIPIIPVRSLPPQPIEQPVNESVAKSSTPRNRRNFTKWLGFGGVGLVSFVAFSQVSKDSSLNKSVSGSKTPKLAINLPKLTKIQFTSIKLDRQGIVIDRPVGSAEIFAESLGNDVELKMVKIPAGKFLMGSPEVEQELLAPLLSAKQLHPQWLIMMVTLLLEGLLRANISTKPPL